MTLDEIAKVVNNYITARDERRNVEKTVDKLKELESELKATIIRELKEAKAVRSLVSPTPLHSKRRHNPKSQHGKNCIRTSLKTMHGT